MNKTSDTESSAFAEYTSLRQEIATRKGTENTILTLQITIAGALYSFALSGPGRLGFLLIVPFTTYMLFNRFAQQYYGVLNAQRYITDVLSPRVKGGFGWDEWRVAHGIHTRSGTHALVGLAVAASTSVITFPAVSAVALLWTIPFTFFPQEHRPVAESVGLAAAWLAGVLATSLAGQIGLRLRRVYAEG